MDVSPWLGGNQRLANTTAFMRMQAFAIGLLDGPYSVPSALSGIRDRSGFLQSIDP